MENGFLFGLTVGALITVLAVEKDTAKKLVNKGKKAIENLDLK